LTSSNGSARNPGPTTPAASSGQAANPRQREADGAEQLTPQELQVARFVAAGATSKQAAAQLFLSPHHRRPPAQHLCQTRHYLRSELRDANLGEIGQ